MANRGARACAAITTVLVITPAAASAASSQPCASNVLTEPFSAFGDTNQYALVPGESADNFAATGWALFGGTKIVTTKLYDGTAGEVLQIPSGGDAVSPPMCVTSSYSSLRTMLRNMGGSAGVNISVAITAPGASANSSDSIAVSSTAWTLSPVLPLAALSGSGAEQAVFTLSVAGKSSEYQIYDLYVDPRMRF